MPTFDPWALLTPALILAAAVLPPWLWTRRTKVSRWLFAAGALAWAVTVACKALFAVTFNSPVRAQLTTLLGASVGPHVFEVYVGLLTGAFEVGLLALAAITIRRLRTLTFAETVGFGLGFGGMEALLIGVASLVMAVTRPSPVTTELLVTPIVERLATLPIHTLACVWVLYAPTGAACRRGWRTLAAFLYKSAIDGAAAWSILSFSVKTSVSHRVEFEAVLVVVALASALVLRHQSRHQSLTLRSPLQESNGLEPAL